MADGLTRAVRLAPAATLAETVHRARWQSVAGVFALALTARLLALALFWLAAPQPVETLLGPDARGYLRGAQMLAARDFVLDAHPAAALGTYNAAPYFVFGYAVWLGAGLMDLQILNAVFGAAAAAFTFAAMRRTAPRYAMAGAVLIALNPSLIVLSSTDLLKDPSITCALAAAVYALVAGLTPQSDGVSRMQREFLLVLAAGALAYLHTARFYVAAYVELGLLAGAGIATGRSGAGRPTAAWATGVVAVAQAVPLILGWPLSPRLITDQVTHTIRTANWQTAQVWDAHSESGLPAFGQVAVEQAASAVRRFFGPFVWIPPDRWDLATIVYGGDYLLYPGTLLWYAMLPYFVAGVWSALRGLKRTSVRRMRLVPLAVFALLYFAQFAVLDLSYRQRDGVFPVVLVLAIAGYQAVRHWLPWRYLYTAYALGLLLVALAHLAFRMLGTV